MQIEQIRIGRLAVFCYLVADKETKTCAVIDPGADPKKILQKISRSGYTVTDVINTHGHMDHTGGNARIIAQTGARLHIHRLDAPMLKKKIYRFINLLAGHTGSPKPDNLLEHGDVIEIGRTRLEVLHTPGHTPGGICLHSHGNLFTGDTIFIQGFGRTDSGHGSALKLAESIRTKIYSLPDETIIWPGHDYARAPSATLGQIKIKGRSH